VEKSSFFNSVNGDRKYKAEDYANYFNKFITNGVFPNVASNLQVIADGTDMTVKVKAGSAWINGYMYQNTSDLVLPIDVADGVLSRIDRVVIQLSFADRDISATVKKGTFASSPIAPILQRDADVFELAVADISISNGVTNIQQSMITDLRLNTALCGYVNSLLQADTSAIFDQYQNWFDQTSLEHEQEFDTWFDTVKGQLSGDVAGNLQNQITTLDGEVDTLTTNTNAHLADFNEHQAENAIDAHNASSISVADANNRFTGTNVETVLDELFQFANNGKTDIASVIGSPATNGDTFTQLKTHIQNSKNTLATNLSNKGQSSVGTEGLASLVAKVANVNTGKKWASGNGVSNGGAGNQQLYVSGLTFEPMLVVAKYSEKDNTDYGNSGGLFIYINKLLIGTVNNINFDLTWTGGYSNSGRISVFSGGFAVTNPWPNKPWDWLALE
jgi:hypothetical protein